MSKGSIMKNMFYKTLLEQMMRLYQTLLLADRKKQLGGNLATWAQGLGRGKLGTY